MAATINSRKYGVAVTSFVGGISTAVPNLLNILSKGLFTHL